MPEAIDTGAVGKPFVVKDGAKQIECLFVEHGLPTSSKSKSKSAKPSLIFTHGAGGGLHAEALLHLYTGFSRVSSMICFKGNMNLKARVRSFNAVKEDQKFATCLGGRSMGARAAVISATEDSPEKATHLILVSYPLQAPKGDLRDQILLDLPESVKVLFVSGTKDSMCDLQELERVRKEMRAKSWRIVVSGADHGMHVTPKKATEPLGVKVGELAARWLKGPDDSGLEGEVTWNDETEEARWSGWNNPSKAAGMVETANDNSKKRKSPDEVQPAPRRSKRNR
ncbi:hypothetical protein MMC25_004097 [Agyrium rufum]|nr:hypothetical protein [Agyrium rufum]